MKERDIFDAALTIASPVERDAFLRGACTDAAHVEQLRALIEAQANLGTFLETPAPGAPGHLESIGAAESPGTVIGNYTLLSKIGEGGMGVVFLAEQTRTVQRKVALKVIKPGMDSRQVIARFEAERQALAVMEHPNIARVIDGGSTESGRPYFVMELVTGVPITEYCHEHQLDIERRLKLFINVCHAIEHAHQKGIIHRDIKPSNVLVTLHDGQPVAKVIDFGIAKAIEQKLTEKTFCTAAGQMMGTPAYMSPEQSDTPGIDIDTRSDIYSLGVLLYELMTGTTPIDAERLRTAGFGEIQKLIRDEIPPRPSARVNAVVDKAGVKSANWSTDSRRLSRILAADLDWIIMKALEKDRGRRYGSTGDFVADLERFLRGDAIEARPPSVTYRLARFIGRHRGGVLAVSVTALALLAGAGIATWQAVVATHAKNAAQTSATTAANARLAAEAKEAETRLILEFTQNRIFAAPRPLDESGGLGKDVTLRGTLAAALAHVDHDFADQPIIEARVRRTLGTSFLLLGDAEIALRQHLRAHAICTRLLGPTDEQTLMAENDLACSYLALRQDKKARELCEHTLEHRRLTLGPDHPLTLESMNNLAKAFENLGEHQKALDLREKTLAGRRLKLGPKHHDTLLSMMNLSNSYAEFNRTKDALNLDEEALALAEATVGADHPYALLIRNSLALDYAEERRFDDALKLQRATVEVYKAKLGDDHPQTLTCMRNVAKALNDLERYEESVTLLLDVLARQTVKPGPEHPDTLHTMYGLGLGYSSLHKYAESVKWHQKALDLRKAKLGPDKVETLYSMWGVVHNLIQDGRGSEALPILDECLERAAAHPNADFSGLAEKRLAYFEKERDAEGCVATAAIWEKMGRTDASSLFVAARFRAISAAVLRENDPSPDGIQRAQSQTDQAMTWLHKAVAAGFKDKDALAKRKEFDALRDRPDFRTLIGELQAKQK
jgi:eukaryotic-like serine/threonine-protein kinase